MDGRKEGEEVWGGRKEGRARVTQYLIVSSSSYPVSPLVRSWATQDAAWGVPLNSCP